MVVPSSPTPRGPHRPVATLRPMPSRSTVLALLVAAVVVSIGVLWGGVALPTHHPGQRHWGTLDLASNASSLAVGDATAIHLYQGVFITPASGWTVAHSGHQSVLLRNGDHTAGILAVADSANAPDINQEATADISADIKGSGLTDVQQVPVGRVQTVRGGSTYRQLLEVGYTANLQTDQGTEQIFGFWVALSNPSTRTMGFVDFFSPDPDVLNDATPAFKHMVLSML